MADEKAVLMYKGRPLMRKDNLIYYGSMADSHIIMMQILETKKVGDADIASRVSVQLQLTDPAARSRDRVVKKSEKDGFYTALDVGCVWLERALAGNNSPQPIKRIPATEVTYEIHHAGRRYPDGLDDPDRYFFHYSSR